MRPKLLFLLFIGWPLVTAQHTERSGATEPRDETPDVRYRVRVVAPPVIEGNRLDRYGSLISAVSSDQIEDLNAQDLASALRRVPGVSISRYNIIGSYGGGSGGAVFIRGPGSGRPGAEISTMVDGIPRFVGIWAHPLLDTVSIDFADRIDIYKSAQPVLFGNMSIGAVNVVPRRMDREGILARYRGPVGEDNTLVQQGEFGGRKDRWDFYLTRSYRSSDGHHENADGRVGRLCGSVGAELTDEWSLTAQFSHSDGWANDPGQVRSPPTPETKRYETNAHFYLIKVSHTTSRWRSTLSKAISHAR